MPDAIPGTGIDPQIKKKNKACLKETVILLGAAICRYKHIYSIKPKVHLQRIYILEYRHKQHSCLTVSVSSCRPSILNFTHVHLSCRMAWFHIWMMYSLPHIFCCHCIFMIIDAVPMLCIQLPYTMQGIVRTKCFYGFRTGTMLVFSIYI